MLAFILTAVGVSLSGVMAPGPITAATLAAGTQRRHAGALIALGHLVIEFPLILLLVTGLGTLLESKGIKAGIGLAGGAVLCLMGAQLLLGLRKLENSPAAPAQRHPFWTGVVLTGANPYFLLWWATVGLALASQAMEFGLLALGLFAVVHWLCDLGWLEALSVASFQGSELLGRRAQQVVFAFCAAALIGFGLKFLGDAAIGLSG